MSKFIVWDKEDKKFIEKKQDYYYNELLIDMSGKLVSNAYNIHEYGDDIEYLEESVFETFPYIGKIDINGNKIYADCSIIEFDRVDRNFEGDESFRRKEKAFFTYCFDGLKYVLKWCEDENLGFYSIVDYDPYFIENIKIVDTIQENKLGLIKAPTS